MFEEINHNNTKVKVKRGFWLKVLYFFENIFSFEFFMSYFLGIELDVLIGGFVGLKYSRFDSAKNIFDFTFSLIVVIFYGLVTIIISINVYRFSRKPKDKVEDLHKFTVYKKWEFL